MLISKNFFITLIIIVNLNVRILLVFSFNLLNTKIWVYFFLVLTIYEKINVNIIFCSYLNRHVVEKLEVVNKKWVRVNLQPGSSVDGTVRQI